MLRQTPYAKSRNISGFAGVWNVYTLASELQLLGEAAAAVALCTGKQSIPVGFDVLSQHKLMVMLSQRKIDPLHAFSLLQTNRKF